MDKTGWIIHCSSRFLASPPPDAVINVRYYLWDDNIQRPDGISVEPAVRIAHHEQELWSGIYKKVEESILVRGVEDKAGVTNLWSWDSNASLLFYRVDSYFAIHLKREVFLHSGEVTHGKEEEGGEAINDISRDLRSREPKEAPTESGFCIDHACIAGDSFQDEEFGVGVTFPNHPSARFKFRSPTGSELNSLPERVDGLVQNMLVTAAGVEGLRKGEHPVGSLLKEKYLVARSNKGQHIYIFMWKVQGKEESLTEPNLTAELVVLERSNEDGKPLPPAFKLDKEALELWDAAVDSIHVRPTFSSLRGGNTGPSPVPRLATPGGQTPDGDYAYGEFPPSLRPKDSWLDNLQEQPVMDIIRLGGTTGHGGVVVEAFDQTDPSSESAAGIGHQVVCPLCKGTFPIIEGNALLDVNEVPVALHRAKTACGASLVASGPLGAVES